MATAENRPGVSNRTMLTHENYPVWKFRMMAKLGSLKLLEAAGLEQPAKVKPSSSKVKEDPEAAAAAAEELEANAKAALYEVQLSISEALIPNILGLSSVQEVFAFLEKQHSQRSTAQLLQLRQQLLSLSMRPGEGVAPFFTRVRQLKQQLSNSGGEPSDTDLRLSVIQAVRSRFRDAYFHLAHSPHFTSWEEFEPILLTEERSNSSPVTADESATAHFLARPAKGRPKQYKPAGQRAGRGGGRGDGRQNSTAQDVPGTDGRLHTGVRCHNCNAYGHYRATCPKPPSKPSPMAHIAAALPPSAQATATNAYASTAGIPSARCHYLSHPEATATDWVVDSGATHHITSHAAALSSVRAPTVPYVLTATGEQATVTAMGTLHLRTEGEVHQLTEVLLVPSSSVNIFSVARSTPSGSPLRTLCFSHLGAALYVGKKLTLFAPRRTALGLCSFRADTLIDDEVSPGAGGYAEQSEAGQLSASAAVVTEPASAAAVKVQSDGPAQIQCCNPRPNALRGTHTPEHTQTTSVAPEGAVRTGGGAAGQPQACCDLAVTGPASAHTWHRRLGHLGKSALSKLQQQADGAAFSTADLSAVVSQCETCALTKQQAGPHHTDQRRATAPLMVVHSDVCGPFETDTPSGGRYMVTMLDEFTAFSAVRIIRSKSDAAQFIKDTIQLWENQQSSKVMKLRTDRGREYMSEDLQQWLRSKGILWDPSAPYTPQQNGAAERLNRTLAEKVRPMMLDAALDSKWWGETAVTANYLRNLSPIQKRSQTPHEMWYKQKPDVSHLRIFGCRAFVLQTAAQRPGKNMEPTAVKGQLIGYEPGSKLNFRVLVTEADKIIVVPHSRIKFLESDAEVPTVTEKHPAAEQADEEEEAESVPQPVAAAAAPANAAATAVDSEEEEMQEADEDSDSGSDSDSDSDSSVNEPAAAPPPAPTRSSLRLAASATATAAQNPAPTELRRSARQAAQHSSATQYALMVTAASAEPKSYKEAMQSADREHWQAAMDDEMESLRQHNVMELQRTPPGVKPLSLRWVYKWKQQQNGSFKAKARLCAKGFTQRQGVDFEEVFAPVSKHSTVRMLIAKVASQDLELHQLDIKTAFLHGELEEDVWVKQPEGYQVSSHSGFSCRLRKALYGLKQAPRAWHQKLHSVLQGEMGFTACSSDPGLYVQHSAQHGSIYILVYVDDLLVAASSMSAVRAVKASVSAQFDTRDLGEAKSFIGLEITRDRSTRTAVISQQQLTLDIINKYGQTDTAGRDIPMAVGTQLQKDSKQLQPNVPYAALVGSIMYLSQCTRPDLAFTAGVLARFMAQPTVEAWTAAKNAVKYLRTTADVGIVYSAAACVDANDLHTVGYTDADYGGEFDTRRSTSSYVFKLYGGAVSWNCKLQRTVATSTAEAEYMASAACVKEAIWIRQLLRDLNLPVGHIDAKGKHKHAQLLLTDNQASLQLLRNPQVSGRAKHIAIHYHFARERVQMQHVDFQYISTVDMLADALTKALPKAKLEAFKQSVGLTKIR